MMRCAVLALVGVALCPSPAPAGAVLDAIRATGTLRVGTTGDYKPFTFRKPDGGYAGADIALAGALAQRLRLRLVFVPTRWATLSADLAADRFDIAMGGVSVTPERAAIGTFSAPVFSDGKRPLVRCADRGRYTSLAAIDRPEVRVVVNPGGTNESFAKQALAHAHLTVHADNLTVFDELLAGRADVMVTDGAEVDHEAATKPGLCAADVGAPFTRFDKAYLMRTDPDLAALVDGWIADERRSGHLDAVLRAALTAP